MKTAVTFIVLVILFSGCLVAGTRYYRLSYRDDPATTVVVGWCDNDTSTNAKVYYGTTDYGTNYLSYPLSHGIDRSVDNYCFLNHHFARLTQLMPNTVYYFVVHDDQGTSARMCFKTLPDNAGSPVTFIAGGDSRTANKGEFADSAKCRIWRQDANRLVSKISPDFITFSGDYVLSGLYPVFWNDWFTDWQLTITPDGRLFPLVPTLGNHEHSMDLYNMFDVPDTNSYYALGIAGKLLRIYTLNTDIGCETEPFFCDSTQRNWLENDLQQHTGNLNEPYWKFAQYHYPFAAHATYPVNHTMVNCWASLFQDYKVKLVAESHAHVIKFTWPVVTSSVASDSGFVRNDTNGVVYVGEGSWGAPLRPLFTHYSPEQAWKWTRNQAYMPGFQLMYVSMEKIEVRVVEVDSVDINNVGQVGLNDPPGTLPANLVLWNPSNGSVVTIKHQTPSGLPEIPAGKAAVIYPNPANNMVHIDFSDRNNSAMVNVYNAFGCSILSLSADTGNTLNIDVSSFNTGVYFVRITMKKFSENYKISIIR